ncbi:MAG: hypothetical protein RPG89_13330 [Microcystis panniformis WG22]|nr:hypothetical protein [Microcystis panniformis WG22]
MFVAFEIPLADARHFVNQGTHLLTSSEPSGQSESLDESSGIPFTRSFGKIHRRCQGGTQNWDNEHFFGESRRALRFEPWLGKRFFSDCSKNTIQWVSRRLFRSRVTSRLEIDFKFSKVPKDGSDLKQTLIDLASLYVRVPHIDINLRACTTGGETRKKLKEIGSTIALRLLYSTTKHSNVNKPERWWISAASPFLIVELERERISGLPNEAKQVYRIRQYDIDLYYLPLYPYCNEEYLDVWILLYDKSKGLINHKFLREVRLNISRFVTERKCLQIFISHINHNRIRFERESPNGIVLQDYLKYSLDLLEKGKGLNFSKETRSHLVSAMVRQADDLVHPGDYITLLKCLQDIRGNLLRQMKSVIEEQMSHEAVINYYLTLVNQAGSNIGVGINSGDIESKDISGVKKTNLSKVLTSKLKEKPIDDLDDIDF